MTSQTETTSASDIGDGWDWAVVEIMGHRRHAGRIREEERFGAKMIRIDVPTVTVTRPADGGEPTTSVEKWITHWYGGPSIFSITPTDEDSVMRINRPLPSYGRYLAPPDEDAFDDPDVERAF